MQEKPLAIPPQCFKYQNAETQISTEQEKVTPVTKFTWDRGIFLYLEGGEYPMKGMTSPETMWALNLAKRIFIESFRFFARWYFIPSYLIITILPWKQKMKILTGIISSYCSINWKNMSPFFLKSDYMTSLGQELEWLSYSFLKNLGIADTLASQFSEIFSALVDYDTGYRYRIQDIFSETSKTALMGNTTKELSRLLKILKQRDAEYIYRKFKLVVWGLRFALLFPNFRKAFKAAVSEVDIRKMGLDEIDTYWVCLRNDEYKFLGKTQKEREEMLKASGKSKPILRSRV